MDELAQWKADNLEITGKFTRACARIRELEAALRKIGAYETYAREMVAKGFHNTTLAIDLAGMANTAIAS